MSDTYHFLKTTEHDGRIMALMGDADRLGGEAGVSALRSSFRANAAPHLRGGVIPMSIDQLRERLPELEQHGMVKSASAFRRAIQCIHDKDPHAAPAGPNTPDSANGSVRETPAAHKPKRAGTPHSPKNS